MIPNIVKGSGVTGAIRYALGEGIDPETKQRRTLEPGQESRAEIVGGQGFGFPIDSPERLEIARRVMEWAAAPENQAGTRGRKCERDCLHMSLSWAAGQDPDKDEMERAAKEALKALGMEKARAVFIAHNDTDHKHVHIIASRIDPLTGKTFSDTDDMRKAQAWGLKWERENNQVSENRKELHGLAEAIEQRDLGKILEHMTARHSTFTAKELDRALSYGMPDKGEREKLRLEVLANAETIGLRDTTDGPVTRYTTRTVLAAERAVMRASQQMAARSDYSVPQSHLDAVEARLTLLPEQRDAYRHATGSSGFAIIAGEAGTGKSYTFSAIRTAYEEAGRDVIGLSWTNAVVQDMRRDGFENARTMASELKRLETGRSQWTRNTVLMVDEAAMLSTKHLGALMEAAAQAGAKVILAGDDKQLASIERGGMFRELVREHGSAELKKVQRTKDTDQQRAFNLMHEGEFAPALEIFDRKGAINWTETHDDAARALSERYTADVTADPAKKRFIFAYTNDEVKALNAQARDLARQHGRLQGDDQLVQTNEGQAAFAQGDRIQFTGNAKDRKGRNAGLVNGGVGTVRGIDTTKDGKHVLTVELDAPKGVQPHSVKFTVGEDKEQGEFNQFRHGYAGTIYKGQGRTLDQSYVLHSKNWRAASSYVALTRHRDSVAVFASREVVRDAEPWMMKQGGLDALDGKLREAAERSYEIWKTEKNPEAARRHGIADYVQYVQDQWAKENQGGDLAQLAKQMGRRDEKRAAMGYVLDPSEAIRFDHYQAQQGRNPVMSEAQDAPRRSRLANDDTAHREQRDRQIRHTRELHEIERQQGKPEMARAWREQMQRDAEAAQAAQAQAPQRPTGNADIEDADARYKRALGNNYSIRDPYTSLANAAMDEFKAFSREQADLAKQAEAEKDPNKRRLIELRREIQGHEYMAVTSTRLAGMSRAISGSDSALAHQDDRLAQAHSERAKELRSERLELQQAIEQGRAPQQHPSRPTPTLNGETLRETLNRVRAEHDGIEQGGRAGNRGSVEQPANVQGSPQHTRPRTEREQVEARQRDETTARETAKTERATQGKTTPASRSKGDDIISRLAGRDFKERDAKAQEQKEAGRDRGSGRSWSR